MKNIVAKALVKKNEILFKHTGVTLIPDDQIEDVEYQQSDMIRIVQSLDEYSSLAEMRLKGYGVYNFIGSTILGGRACPYCTIYNENKHNDCDECPMQLDNQCDPDTDNTWNQATQEIDILPVDERANLYHDICSWSKRLSAEIKKDLDTETKRTTK